VLCFLHFEQLILDFELAFQPEDLILEEGGLGVPLGRGPVLLLLGGKLNGLLRVGVLLAESLDAGLELADIDAAALEPLYFSEEEGVFLAERVEGVGHGN
jgi:hypothetical protein